MDSRPAITRTQRNAPFVDLSGEDFERLCYALVLEDARYTGVEHFGAAGADGGRDLVAYQGDRRIVFQCKGGRTSFSKSVAERTLKQLAGLPEPKRPHEVVFLVAANVSAQTRDALAAAEQPLEFSILGATEMDAWLAGYPDLEAKFFGRNDTSALSPFYVPFRPLNDLLKGREKELKALEKGLQGSASGAFAVTQQKLEAVHGLGGVGKTALAVEHAWRCRARYSGVFFVRAESQELLQAGLAELAPVLKLPEIQDQDVAVGAVLEWLEEHSGWLLILDNVDDEEAAAAATALLPRLSSGRVLITSRLSNWSADVDELPLDVLDLEEAAELLLDRASKRVPAGDDPEQATSLAEELGRLPLALEQAAAYISVHRGSFASYREMLAEDSAKVTKWFDPRVMRYPRSIAATWQPSFERLGSSARAMLHLVAFLAPEGIPRSLFEGKEAQGVLEEAAASFNLSEAVRELSAYSFLQAADTGFSVHRMVQEVVRSRIRQANRKEWVGRAVDLLKAADPGNPQDARHWSAWRKQRPHAERVIRHAWAAGLGTTNLALLMSQIANYLFQLALHSEAEPLMRRALAIDESSYGENHPTVARDLNNLAQLLKATNRLSEAEPLMRRALAIDESSYGEKHPRVAIDLNNLAQLLKATNRLSEAEPLMRRALAIDESSYGEKHPEVAIDLNNLATLLQATNRLSEAEPLMRRALAIDESSYGEKHPRVAIDLNNLAQLLKATNRFSEAEPLMRRALEIDESSYGEKHPTVAIRLNNLATLLQATNRLSEAEPLMRRALAIDESSYGKNHPDVAIDLNNLARLLQDLDRLDEAIPLMTRAVAIFEASLVEGHPNTETARANLAAMLKARDEAKAT